MKYLLVGVNVLICFVLITLTVVAQTRDSSVLDARATNLERRTEKIEEMKISERLTALEVKMDVVGQDQRDSKNLLTGIAAGVILLAIESILRHVLGVQTPFRSRKKESGGIE